MANEVVNRRLNIYIDQATAEQSLERLTKKENELVAAIERQKKAGKDATKQMNDLADTRNRIGQIKDVMDGKVLPSIRMAEAAVQKLNRELKSLPANSEAAAQKLQQLRAAEQTLLRVRNAANGINTSLNDIAKNQGFLGKIQNGLGSLLGNGGILAGGILAGGAVLSSAINFLSEGVDEALQAEEAAARLKATLDNLGKSDAFERISSQADNLAESLGFLDNDDILGVFDKLLLYGKLTEEQIKKLVPVILDFAAKQRIDLGTATDVITKALEGNGKALKTYGINISDAKDETEAFGIIMDQLKPKVDGAAKAFGETTAGQIAKTKQEIANLKESISTDLLPVIKEFFSAISGVTQRISFLYDKAKDMSFWERLKLGFKTVTSGGKNLVTGELEDDFQRQRRLKELSRNAPGLPSSTIPSIDQTVRRGTGLTDEEIKKTDGQRVLNSLKRENEKALKDFQDVKNKVQDVVQPILAAYRKVNEEAEDRIKKINEALKRGLITPQQAREALNGVEEVLKRELDNLASKRVSEGRIDFTSFFDLDEDQARAKMKSLIETMLKTGFEEATKLAPTKIPVKVDVVPSKQVQADIDASQADPIGDFARKNQDNAQYVLDTISGLTDAYTNLSQVRAAAEDAALQKELQNNELRKRAVQELFDKRVISQQEYERRVAQIDKQSENRQREIRKRQFERDKNAQTVQALIGAASAIISTLAARPGTLDAATFGVLRAVQVGLVAATTGAQIAAIRSAKAPQFADGGFLPDGPSHAQGGIALVDRAGRKIGEVEGGEPILSRKTYARNKPLIDMLMAGSQSGTGLMTMNIPRITSSMKTVFENGGFIPRATEASSNELTTAVKDLNQILANGIIAKMLYGEYEDVSNRINNIRSQSIVS
jgi:hypothetical protein